jgi:hypothetical protein
MQTVDEKPETIQLYVVREKEPKPSVFPIVLSALSLIVLLAFCVLAPYQQPVTRAVIRVPAVLLPVRTFSARISVIPTGVRVYPATTAHGVLTITNGSIIGQVIPASFTASNVASDYAVYVPPGNANGYGYAIVTAHALISGKGGNFATLAINQVIGSSVYIRNLSAFTGGKDAYSVKFATAQDKQTALTKVRNTLALQTNGLHYPCQELYLQNALQISVTWRCIFVTYSVPSYMHVTDARLVGRNVIVSVLYTEHPMPRRWVK